MPPSTPPAGGAASSEAPVVVVAAAATDVLEPRNEEGDIGGKSHESRADGLSHEDSASHADDAASHVDGADDITSRHDDTISHTMADESEVQTPVMRGVLSKWTNYMLGWQDRYVVLDGGVLSYFKTIDETDRLCRGEWMFVVRLLSLVWSCVLWCVLVNGDATNAYSTGTVDVRQAVIHRHEFDNLRFDVGIEDSTFYLRADSKEKREEWVVALEKTKVLLLLLLLFLLLFLLFLLVCGM